VVVLFKGRIKFWMGALMGLLAASHTFAQIATDSTEIYFQQLKREFSMDRFKQWTRHMRNEPFMRQESLVNSLIDKGNLTPVQIGRVYNYFGVAARKTNRFAKAMQYHKHALLYLEYTTDTLERINALNNLAIALRKLNLENEAFHYYIKAKTLADKIGHKRSQAIALHGIANVFIDLGDYERAIRYLYQSFAIEKSLNNLIGIEYNYSNLAEAYTMLHQFDSAHYYLTKSVELAKKLYGNHLGIEYSLVGKYYFEKGNYPQARYYYKKSLEDVTQKKIQRYVANDNIMIGRTYLKENKPDKALPYLNTGLKIARDIGSRENIILAYDGLKTLYQNKGDYRRALYYLTNKERYKDSMINMRSLQSINSLEVLHKVTEKDRKIKQLALEKQRVEKKSKFNRRIAIATALISTLIILLLWRINYLRKINQDLELEKLNREIQQYILRLNELQNKEDQRRESDRFPSGKPSIDYVIAKLAKEHKLTPRQLEILELILKGHSNKEIAQKLFISNNTVKTHIHHLYEKLNVKNRMEIIQRFMEKES